MTKRLIFLIFASLAALYSCRNDGTREIRSFYFPLNKLTEGMVYEYRASDALTPAYWYYRSFVETEKKYLTGTYYEQELEPLQMTRELMVSNGILLDELRIFKPEDATPPSQTVVEVAHGNVFPFKVRDSLGVFLYKISWKDEEGQQITLTRNRRFMGDTSFVFNGITYPCVLFKLLESVELDHPTQGYFEQALVGREGYAKGLGLVFYEKAPKGRQPQTYRLFDRYPMSELESKARRRIKQ
jgi:hypothetical protein